MTIPCRMDTKQKQLILVKNGTTPAQLVATPVLKSEIWKKFSTIPKSMATQSGPIHNQFSDIILSHSSQLFNVKSIMETFLAHFVLTWKADL